MGRGGRMRGLGGLWCQKVRESIFPFPPFFVDGALRLKCIVDGASLSSGWVGLDV